MTQVPSLDAIAADPGKAHTLPRPALVALAVTLQGVWMAVQTALLASVPVESEMLTHEETCDAGEVARLFGVSKSTVEHHARTRLPYQSFLIPDTRPMMFSRSKIDRYIRQRAGASVDESSVGLRGVNTGRRPRTQPSSPGGAAS